MHGKACLLMAPPGTLVMIKGFGGEVLFRAFLFAARDGSVLFQASLAEDDLGR
jgi:hypothetical protein